MVFWNKTVVAPTVRLDGKTVLVTGASAGIGKATACDFYRRGARVLMACRNLEKTNVACEEIRNECKDIQDVGVLEFLELNLGNLEQVRQCATQLLAKGDAISILVNNAAVMACPLQRTPEGYELQMVTNHLGHFLLTLMLLPLLKKGAPARIVIVSSSSHAMGGIDLSDLNWDSRTYSPLGAYNQSKLANILFASELAEKLRANEIDNITTYSLHPGIVKTDASKTWDQTYFRGISFLFRNTVGLFSKSPAEGAKTTIHCALSEEAAEESGLYYANCKPTFPSAAAQDRANAEKLWTDSLKLVKWPENRNPFE